MAWTHLIIEIKEATYAELIFCNTL